MILGPIPRSERSCSPCNSAPMSAVMPNASWNRSLDITILLAKRSTCAPAYPMAVQTAPLRTGDAKAERKGPRRLVGAALTLFRYADLDGGAFRLRRLPERR